MQRRLSNNLPLTMNFRLVLQKKYHSSVGEPKGLSMKLSGGTEAVPEGKAIRDSENLMPLEEISAGVSVPVTSGESLAESGSKKRSGTEQDTALERAAKRRVNPDPDSDTDVIVLLQPGTHPHGRAENQVTAANIVSHHIICMLSKCICFGINVCTCNIQVLDRIHLHQQESILVCAFY